LKNFGESNDTKASMKQWMVDPREAEDRMEACRRLGRQSYNGKWVTCVSKRESYLSSLCIVFSQEDGCLIARVAYRY